METKECEHKNKLHVYGRGKNNWISSMKFRGEWVFICEDCGEILTEKVKIIKYDVVEKEKGK